jgi:hypothetical protein
VSGIIKDWDKITKATQLTVDILKRILITDNKQLPSYNALIPVIYWHFKTNHREYRDDNDDRMEIDKIRVWLVKALLSGMFGGQTDTVLYKCKEFIDSSKSSIFPAEDIQAGLKALRGRSMDISDELADQIPYRHRSSYLFLSLCYRMAIDFSPIMVGNLPEQDHIFSRHELTEAGVKPDRINNICNVRFVSLRDNRTKSKTPYKEWVTNLGNNREAVFKQHLIPQGDWTVGQFETFLAARRQELMKQLDY